MWLIPVLVLGSLAGFEFVRAIRRMHIDEVDREAAWLVRDYRLHQLSARLALAPLVVRWSRSTGLTNRIILDLGGEEIDARCYHTPSRNITVVTKLFYRPSIGWVIGVDGPNGPGDLAAWLVDVHPARIDRG